MSLRRVAGVFVGTLGSIYTQTSLWRQLTAMLLAWATVLNASGASVMTASSRPARHAGSLGVSRTGNMPASTRPMPARSIPRGTYSQPIQLASLSHVLPRIHASVPPPSGTSTISSNFNGTVIAAGDYIWFNSVISVSGITTYPTRVVARGAVVQFTANQQARSVAVPDTVITYSSTATEASTQYDAAKNQWETTVPSSFSGNVMLTSVPVYLPTGLPAGINPVNWTEHFYSDNPGISVQWQWAAAVYTSFTTNLNAIGAKPIDDNVANPYNNSDHAGTPENFEPYVIGGARGGGGSNWTGSYSGTAALTIPVDTAPVANAGPPQTVPVQTTVTLDGSASTDANGDPLTYQWSIVQAPSGSSAQLVNPTNVRPTITIDKSGDYVIQLVVNDGILNGAPAQVTISTSNSAPVAVAGVNQKVNVGNPVQLDGTGSYDIDGDPLTYQWTITVPSGSTATLDNPNVARPKFTPDVLGDYGVTLVVNDGNLNSQPSSLTVTSGDLPPVANAGPAQTGKYQQTITLDGTKSYDSDHRLIVYQWSFTSKPTDSITVLSDPAEAQPTFVVDQCGHYAIQVIVYDGFFYSTPATTTVDCTNTPPVANAGPNQELTAETTVQLDGSRTTDVDGDHLTYSWSFLSWPGQTQQPAPQLSDSTAVQPTFVAPLPGTYVVQLHVDDGQGGGTAPSAYATVTITSDDIVPIANPGSAQRFNVGDTVTLDGSESSSALGYPLTYGWAFTHVPPGSAATLNNPTTSSPSFTADVLGTYVIALQVNDGFLNSQIVTLTLATNVRPVANPGSPQTVNVGKTITLDGSASSDPDGDSLTYRWAMLSHPAGSVSILDQPLTSTPTFSVDVAGLYVFQLIVNDGLLDSDPKTVTVTGQDPNQPPVVSAGPNLTGTFPNPVQLQGSVTDDGLPKGAPLTIWWSQVSGPGNATFSSTADPGATVTFDQPGTYILKLSADDTEFERDSTVTITYQSPQNQPPNVSAGSDVTINAPAVYQLQGTVTDDGYPVGGKLTSVWSQTDGPPGYPAIFENLSSPTSRVRLNGIGTYTLTLTASDGELSNHADVHITTVAGSKPPLVNAGPDQQIALPNTSALLSGSAYDPAGNPLTLTWTVLPGQSSATLSNANNLSATASLASPGNYVFRLTATDTVTKLAAFADTHVTLLPANQPPVVTVGPSQTITLPNNSVSLTATVTDDGLPSWGALSQQWSVVSGPAPLALSSPTSMTTNATFSAPGVYDLRLTASDGQYTTSADVTITVKPASGSVVLTPASLGPVSVGTAETFQATVLSSSGTPAAGLAVNFGVSGVNPATGTGFTNTNGIATFTYRGRRLESIKSQPLHLLVRVPLLLISATSFG